MLVNNIPTICFSLGTHNARKVAAYSIPDSSLSVRFALARVAPANWLNQIVSWQVEQSNDGATWISLGGSTAQGGALIDPETGLIATESWDLHNLIPGTGRQLRVIFTPQSPVLTLGTVMVS